MTDSSKSKPIRQSGSHYLTDANDELASLLGELENLDLNEAVSEPELSTTPAAAPPRPVAAPPRPVVAPVRGPAESVPDLPSGRRIAQLEAELEALRDKSQRAAGDFANYRKRLKKERDDAVEFANEKVFKDLLTVVDSFQLAVKHASTSNSDSIVNGVKMIYQQMLGTLGRHGMQPFQSVDAAFDPRLHQAVSRVVRGDVVPGTVVSTAQQGFTLKGRLLRPALVSVAVAK
ncbi:MAG: molecular chaperone GrpE, partial [Myxococcota bacterium]